jgi:hypothetical protein
MHLFVGREQAQPLAGLGVVVDGPQLDLENVCEGSRLAYTGGDKTHQTLQQSGIVGVWDQICAVYTESHGKSITAAKLGT